MIPFVLPLIASVCLQEGELRAQLNELIDLTDVSVMYDWNVIGPVRRARFCPPEPLTANAALTGLLAGTRFTWDWVNERTLAVTPIGACHPEWGANAPAPPCLPPALPTLAKGY
jgi:hypothetical protein